MSNCTVERRVIKSYTSLFVSAYGRTKADVTANRFEISFLDSDMQIETYVLRNNIFNMDPSGQKVKVEFCTSVFGLKMYKEVIEVLEN